MGDGIISEDWDDLLGEDSVGTEGGEVVADEGYKYSCRITLEKLNRGYAITCGVYGDMVHTVYCGDDCMSIYNEMKSELEKFIDSDLTDEEKNRFYDDFISKF